MSDIRHSSRSAAGAVAVAMLLVLSSAQAAVVFYNAANPGQNVAVWSAWQTAVLAAPGTTGIAVVDFESGFTDGQNISGMVITGSHPEPIRITDVTAGNAIIETGLSSITGSHPIGSFAVEVGVGSVVRIDFLLPTFAAAFVSIDHQELPLTIGFSDSTSVSYAVPGSPIDETGSTGDTGEFLGIFLDPVQDGRRISYIEFGLAASGDLTWGLDNIMYQVPEPSSLALMGLVGLGLLSRRRRRA